jgi:hypothetical protein
MEGDQGSIGIAAHNLAQPALQRGTQQHLPSLFAMRYFLYLSLLVGGVGGRGGWVTLILARIPTDLHCKNWTLYLTS